MLQDVADAFGLTIAESVQVTGGFSGAVVHRVLATNGQTFAIRHLPLSAAIDRQRQAELAQLTADVFHSGVQQVPVPLRPRKACRGGETFDAFIETSSDRWIAEPWKPGCPISGPDVTRRRVVAAMETLGAFHRAARDAVRARGASEWFDVRRGHSPAIRRRLQMVEYLAAGELDRLEQSLACELMPDVREASRATCDAFRRWMPRLRDDLAVVDREPQWIQPVLRDVWSAHVLFDDDRVTGLIDLTAAATDHTATDVTRLLRSWFRADSSAISEGFVLALEAHVVTADDRRVFSALDAANVLLSPVTWLRRRTETAPEHWTPAMTARLADLAEVAVQFELLPQ